MMKYNQGRLRFKQSLPFLRVKGTVNLFFLLSCFALPAQNTIAVRFTTPTGFERVEVEPTSFASYLRQLPLQPKGALVKYYDGREKANRSVYAAVVNMDIGKKDLQQCADAVMRLRGEYLYGQKKYEKIHFELVSTLKPSYYKDYAKGDYSYPTFRKYMEHIFMSANTASLLHELAKVPSFNLMRIGDVLVQKGVPYGHAVIVVDMATNPKTGQKVYLLAQSYMPAQETQILQNPNNEDISPWYELKDETITTPEWTFQPVNLKRFKDE